MPGVRSLVALAGRAVGAEGHEIIRELEASDVPDDLMLLVHAHMDLEMLLDCVVHGVRSTWRLLQTRRTFDEIFEHRFLEYCVERDLYREEMRKSFLTACDLDAGEFYPLQHSRFQFAPLVVDESATDRDVAVLVGAPACNADAADGSGGSAAAAAVDTTDNSWAVAGPAVYGGRGRDGSVRTKVAAYDAKHAGDSGDDDDDELLPSDTADADLQLDARGWYRHRFRIELQSLLWLARSIHARCKAVEKPTGKPAPMTAGGAVAAALRNAKPSRRRATDCVCRTPPFDWSAEALPCKLATARLFGGTGGVLLKALGMPQLQRYQQKLAIFAEMGSGAEQVRTKHVTRPPFSALRGRVRSINPSRHAKDKRKEEV